MGDRALAPVCPAITTDGTGEALRASFELVASGGSGVRLRVIYLVVGEFNATRI